MRRICLVGLAWHLPVQEILHWNIPLDRLTLLYYPWEVFVGEVHLYLSGHNLSSHRRRLAFAVAAVPLCLVEDLVDHNPLSCHRSLVSGVEDLLARRHEELHLLYYRGSSPVAAAEDNLDLVADTHCLDRHRSHPDTLHCSLVDIHCCTHHTRNRLGRTDHTVEVGTAAAAAAEAAEVDCSPAEDQVFELPCRCMDAVEVDRNLDRMPSWFVHPSSHADRE